jgi:hypothetical protein
MKPLVYYCRWQGAKLRLRGRDETAVWGELVFVGEGGKEETQQFRFDLQKSELTLRQSEGERSILLDEMGVSV